MKVLRKMGFSNSVVDLIWRLLANNYYSILLNGQSHGFFHSTRGVKQGDPLSPALFIISAEVLSRALNALIEDPQYVGYGLPKWSANINHLPFADDTIYLLHLMAILYRKLCLFCRTMRNNQVRGLTRIRVLIIFTKM